MKKLLKKVFSPKKAFAAALVALAVLIPVSSVSATSIKLESSLGVANVTAGDTQYKHSVNATYDQVVKFQVYYHNMENVDSGKIANNLKVKITIPDQAGKTQTVRSTVSADDANTVTSEATVNLDRSDAKISYIPGSAVWRHNKGTNTQVNYVEEKISDNVVLGGQGLVLENTKPCNNFAATVTVLARVQVPGVKVVKQVRVKGEKTWVTSNTAKPGDTLEYMITYQDIGNTKQNKVVVRDSLPPHMTYVNGTTYLYNTTNPNGVKYNSDNITNGGIVIGDYLPGGGAYVKFDVKIDNADKLACGANEFRNVGVAKPEGMNEYYNTAITTVNKTCVTQKPSYSCDLLNVNITSGLQTENTVKYSASNGATFKSVTFDFGDGNKVITDKTTVNHVYTKTGTYNVTAIPSFMVDGKLVAAPSDKCTKVINFAEQPQQPTELPNTGPGTIVGLFAGVTALGTIGYQVAIRRR